MKTNPIINALISLRKFSTLSVAVVAMVLVSAGTSKAQVVFDNMSNYEGGNTNAHVASTGSTPNTFMGDGYVLASGTTAITGFDLFPVNLSGTSYNALKINIFVWGGVNLGAVSAGSPAFSNLLGSYTFTSAGTFTTGFFFPFESATPGVTPGIILGAPLAVSSTTIGITFNYQGSTDGGATYNSANSLTSIIGYGTTPTVGSQVFSGYYRNAASEINGNFTSTLRTLGNANESLGLRIYGNLSPVPEPTTLALIGAGGVMLFLRRRRA